jgi:hypothetical protein
MRQIDLAEGIVILMSLAVGVEGLKENESVTWSSEGHQYS